jgi:endonuclease/exonuclease/phosphatase family metal-dependent hydrolase
MNAKVKMLFPRPLRMNRLALSCALAGMLCDCHTTRTAQVPAGPQLRVLTYNVNWGGPRPDLAAQSFRESGADIVCLQETTPQWEQYLRQALGQEYRFAQFKNSETRMGGGLGFLSRLPAQEVA